MLYSNLVDACNEAMHAAGAFINCAAASFCWSFRVRPIFTTTSLKNNENNDFDQDNDESSLTNADKIETLHTDEKVVVYLNSLSRMSHFLASLSSSGGGGGGVSGSNGGSTSPSVPEQLPSPFSAIAADRNAEFYLKFSIWHGIRQMDSVIIKLDKLEKMISKKVDSFIKPHR
jgi:hypothetical protein